MMAVEEWAVRTEAGSRPAGLRVADKRRPSRFLKRERRAEIERQLRQELETDGGNAKLPAPEKAAM